jgi:hypothetical protein
VSFSFANKFKAVLPGFLLAGALTGAAFVALAEPARAISPAYTTTGAAGGSCDGSGATPPYACGTAQSYGFYFDTDRDVTIDALGFSSQPNWPSGTSPYEVKLWSYVNGGNTPADYQLIETRTFTPGTSYEFKNGYFWQDIPLITLLNSVNGDPGGQRGFVIGVVGDFTASDPGNVLFEGATASFIPGIVNNDSSFTPGTDAVADPDGFFPIPAYPGGQGTDGFFNGNLSFAPVPSPLPMLGAAAGFSWTRRMRQRIRLSR